MNKILRLEADPFAPTIIIDGNEIYNCETFFSLDLIEKIIFWSNNYQKYTALDILEIKENRKFIEDLDKQGSELLIIISNQVAIKNIYQFYYYSICFNIKYVIENNRNQGWYNSKDIFLGNYPDDIFNDNAQQSPQTN